MEVGCNAGEAASKALVSNKILFIILYLLGFMLLFLFFLELLSKNVIKIFFCRNMPLFKFLAKVLSGCLKVFCPSIYWCINSKPNERKCLKRIFSFVGGFTLGLFYYKCVLKKIIFPYYVGVALSLSISLLLAIGNVISGQLRCICLLIIPMYCGKPGRGVMKVILLTYVIAGPITNMCLNAKEVVRVFACNSELSQNLSAIRVFQVTRPYNKAMRESNGEVEEIKDTLRSFTKVVSLIEREIDNSEDMNILKKDNDHIDDIIGNSPRSQFIDNKYSAKPKDKQVDRYNKLLFKKIEYMCQDQLSRATELCIEAFNSAYKECCKAVPEFASTVLCWPMKIHYVCNVLHIVGGPNVCDRKGQIDIGIGTGYEYIKKAKDEFSRNIDNVKMKFHHEPVRQLYDIQDAKETGQRVLHAFEEKSIIMQYVTTVVNICVALLCLRILIAACMYHDAYLTNIGHDNVYITDYFKKIDRRRLMKQEHTLLPLKKMERSRYTDVQSLSGSPFETRKRFTQVLKVMLEMITATTFVMLDRLFYEALAVVRQHAKENYVLQGTQDLEIKVEGTGPVARMVDAVLTAAGNKAKNKHHVSNEECLPRPRVMPMSYFMMIYGGYLSLLLLLYLNPYTTRLRRFICSYFYPQREKHRILHLYNDILKKRLKIQKTLQKKAVQTVRAYYLSGENIRSLRMKFPIVLGWTRILPIARMTCLICNDIEPRNVKSLNYDWYSCLSPKCPFVYCHECWGEVGSRCLACDPSLVEISDVDSLSEEEVAIY